VALSIPAVAAGQRLTASKVQQIIDGLVGLTTKVVKAGDQTVTNSTVLVNDADLLFAVAANAEYDWDALVIYQAPTGQDGKIAWTAPAGATCDWTSDGVDPAVSSGVVAARNFEPRILSDFALTGGIGAGTSMAIRPRGRLVTIGTAGTFRMQFAQSSSLAATSMIVKAASYLSIRRVA
jgi:hypothetical protein